MWHHVASASAAAAAVVECGKFLLATANGNILIVGGKYVCVNLFIVLINVNSLQLPAIKDTLAS